MIGSAFHYLYRSFVVTVEVRRESERRRRERERREKREERREKREENRERERERETKERKRLCSNMNENENSRGSRER